MSLCFIEIPIPNAKCANPDQSPHYMASDLGLHCLPMTLSWGTSINGLKREQKLSAIVGLITIYRGNNLRHSTDIGTILTAALFEMQSKFFRS